MTTKIKASRKSVNKIDKKSKSSLKRKIKLKAYYNKKEIEAGCDEAGRGCLAGPVYAAAVILPLKIKIPALNDSKKLTEATRNELRVIIEKKAIAWAVGIVDQEEIDDINILNASYLAMHRALDQLATPPTHILVDGNRFKSYQEIAHTCIVKGDAKYMSIAAASILAKTYRDDYMLTLHQQYPHYAWDRNKGYPTKQHRAAIVAHGVNDFHRKTFRLLPEGEQGKLF